MAQEKPPKQSYTATSLKGHLDCKQVIFFLPDVKQKKTYTDLILWSQIYEDSSVKLLFLFYSSWNVQKSDLCTVFQLQVYHFSHR